MKRPADERFFENVEKTDACWLWTACTAHGYGRFSAHGKAYRAHRFAYELLVGPIPDGMTIDHLCRVRACVNPDHLEPVTMRENLSRIPLRTHCPQGHAYDAENTSYLTSDVTGRKTPCCRACGRERTRQWRLRRAVVAA